MIHETLHRLRQNQADAAEQTPWRCDGCKTPIIPHRNMPCKCTGYTFEERLNRCAICNGTGKEGSHDCSECQGTGSFFKDRR